MVLMKCNNCEIHLPASEIQNTLIFSLFQMYVPLDSVSVDTSKTKAKSTACKLDSLLGLLKLSIGRKPFEHTYEVRYNGRSWRNWRASPRNIWAAWNPNRNDESDNSSLYFLNLSYLTLSPLQPLSSFFAWLQMRMLQMWLLDLWRRSLLAFVRVAMHQVWSKNGSDGMNSIRVKMTQLIVFLKISYMWCSWEQMEVLI